MTLQELIKSIKLKALDLADRGEYMTAYWILNIVLELEKLDREDKEES
jgi:hypothetical protein